MRESLNLQQNIDLIVEANPRQPVMISSPADAPRPADVTMLVDAPMPADAPTSCWPLGRILQQGLTGRWPKRRVAKLLLLAGETFAQESWQAWRA
jgi:hypothetical protein